MTRKIINDVMKFNINCIKIVYFVITLGIIINIVSFLKGKTHD